MAQWEYLTLFFDEKGIMIDTGDDRKELGPGRLAAELDRLGADSWELVSVAALYDSELTTGGLVHTFKRPLLG